MNNSLSSEKKRKGIFSRCVASNKLITITRFWILEEQVETMFEYEIFVILFIVGFENFFLKI